jgi:predicted membrane protein
MIGDEMVNYSNPVTRSACSSFTNELFMLVKLSGFADRESRALTPAGLLVTWNYCFRMIATPAL